MAADIPTIEPAAIRAGDTWKWTKSLADYPASAWSLKYRLKNARAGLEITANASGDDYSITVSAATSATLAAGNYAWVSWVEAGAEKFTVGSGSLEVLPDLRARNAADAQDVRSHAQKVLDAIEAVLENRASIDQQETAINGTSLKRTPISDLLRLRTRYQNEVRGLQAAEKIAKGMGTGNRIGIRF